MRKWNPVKFWPFLAAGLGFLSGFGSRLEAATLPAPTCNQTDVQNTINAAVEGDTVTIPAGTCSWASTVTTDQAITVMGAGADQTVILDAIDRSVDPNARLFILSSVSEAARQRLTGLTLNGNNNPTQSYSGSVVIGGQSKAWRIDHVHFSHLNNVSIRIYGFAYGVIDHCVFDIDARQAIIPWHDAWNGASYGDGSWADPSYLGTGKAVYIEDNVFNESICCVSVVDSEAGGRYVFRHNTVNNEAIGGHGTESSQRLRGVRAWEIYNNTFNFPPGGNVWTGIFFRSGTGVIFNNTFSAGYNSMTILETFRRYQPYIPWGECDGSSAWDVNDGVTYATGTHTGSTGAKVLTTTGANWTTNQWVGYSLHDTTQNTSGLIVGNTANTMTTQPWANGSPAITWTNGDAYAVLRSTVCIDQPGRGQSDLLTDASGCNYSVFPYSCPIDTVTGTAAWPHNALEPIYGWNNTVNGSPGLIGAYNGAADTVQENRDFFNNTPKPGYTPYVYPHPLVSGSSSFSPCDLNKDNLTNVVDVQLEVNMALGVTSCTADLNQDNVCNVIDVQRVVNAALGGACLAGS